ncbi:MAG: HipA domain-containing protein [Tenacibaculum sp.]|nr:HipA domain-containing protein [Tenacibaculum sp.]
MKELHCCPAKLTKGFNTYSPIALKKLFKGKKISHILPYLSPSTNENSSIFNSNQKHISISGFQEKYSLLLDNSELKLTEENQQGEFILKPISDLPKNKEFAPANEHLTMQIAEQIFKIETAENALIFFKNEEPAYLTKRFDISKNNKKLAVEDFASLSEKTSATHGEHYKYTGSYFDLFVILKKYVPAWQIEAPKLFKLLIFNYLFSNGDAHLKNFSLIETQQGDFKLSPAYDLLNTKLHIEDTDFALKDGLLPKSESGGTIKNQFLKLADLVEISKTITLKILKDLTSNKDEVIDLVKHSFLSERLQRNYIQSYQRKLKKMI